MSKLLLLGAGPLPDTDLPMPDSAALRTWQLARALQSAGQAVDVITIPPDGSSAAENSAALVTSRRVSGLAWSSINSGQFHRSLGALQEIQSRKRYDAMIGVGLNASALLSRLPSTLPAWFDLGDGPPLAETQSRCRVLNSDDGLKTTWARVRSSLRRGDRFSAATTRQTWALVGELGSLGRLNSFTDGHAFASTIPPAVPEWVLQPSTPRRCFRGTVVPEKATIIAWTGLCHPWCDYRTLASALTLALEQEPTLHFVCAGSTHPGLERRLSTPFAEILQRAGFGDRCHFVDAPTAGDALALIQEANLGLMVDTPGYAAALGFHTRLLAWMGAGLPVLTTSGSDLAELLAENDLAYVVKMGAVQDLADRMIRVAQNPAAAQIMARKAAKFARDHFASPSLAAPLLRWAGSPTAAPDTSEKIRREARTALPGEIALNPLEQEALHAEQNLAEELARTRKELEQLKRKLVVRVTRKIFR